MQQKPNSHASTKSYGQPMLMWMTNQGGWDGTTLIARQGLLGPGSWTLLLLGGQFNSRRPCPLGSLWVRARSREQGRLDLNCWATLSLSDEASILSASLPRRCFGFEFILKQAFSCESPVRMLAELGPAPCDCVQAEGEQTPVCHHMPDYLTCGWLAGPTRCG